MRQFWERVPKGVTAGLFVLVGAGVYLIATGAGLAGVVLILCAAIIGGDLARDILRRR